MFQSHIYSFAELTLLLVEALVKQQKKAPMVWSAFKIYGKIFTKSKFEKAKNSIRISSYRENSLNLN